MIDRCNLLFESVLLEDDVQYVKDIDLIPIFELIVDLHYDINLQLIVKMKVQNLFYKAEQKYKNSK